MNIELLPTKTPDEFRKAMESRGWNPDALAKRWGMTRRRIHQIAADYDRPRYYDDAIENLPIIAGK